MRAVFFDIGSTLITGPDQGVAKRLALHLGLSDEDKQAINAGLMTRPFYEPQAAAAFLRDELGIVAPNAAQSIEAIWRAQLGEARALDGALASLRAWAETGACLCFISNIWRPYQLSALAALGGELDRLVPRDQRFYSFEIGAAKPSAAPFERALEAAGCAPQEAIMVGDSYTEDIAPAAALGLATAWVLCRPDKEAGARAKIAAGDAPSPDLTVSRISEFSPARWAAVRGERATSYAMG